ncbi:hypothetical protein TUBRATIS_000690 [Tubulinosema ratisbonensis]|uniref:Uncharacterized protein n=1 Tax=Tubulinosema ratisbonensis TaxID=291195 RepID=A0A437AQL5_9MICR|nr:hypothetical protein TUBRATIS_000690 [Tubulinosema ratisbonensis]
MNKLYTNKEKRLYFLPMFLSEIFCVFFIILGLVIGMVMYFVIHKRIVKMIRMRSAPKVRGLISCNFNCLFNPVIQTLASLDDLYFYLEKSDLPEDSLTKEIYKLLKRLRKSGSPIKNEEYYDAIMYKLIKNKYFDSENPSSAGDLMLSIVKMLFDEEIARLNISYKNLEDLTYDNCEIISKSSFICNLFGTIVLDRNLKIFFSLNYQKYKRITSTIYKIRKNPFNFELEPQFVTFLKLPKYILTSLSYSSSKDMCLNNVIYTHLGSLYYGLNSICLETIKDSGILTCISINRRENDNFYCFDDDFIYRVEGNESFKLDYEITLVVYELNK